MVFAPYFRDIDINCILRAIWLKSDLWGCYEKIKISCLGHNLSTLVTPIFLPDLTSLTVELSLQQPKTTLSLRFVHFTRYSFYISLPASVKTAKSNNHFFASKPLFIHNVDDVIVVFFKSEIEETFLFVRSLSVHFNV